MDQHEEYYEHLSDAIEALHKARNLAYDDSKRSFLGYVLENLEWDVQNEANRIAFEVHFQIWRDNGKA